MQLSSRQIFDLSKIPLLPFLSLFLSLSINNVPHLSATHPFPLPASVSLSPWILLKSGLKERVDSRSLLLYHPIVQMESPPPDDCSVKVAVHIRPLIGDERLQGCKDCVTVVPGKPQVQFLPSFHNVWIWQDLSIFFFFFFVVN